MSRKYRLAIPLIGVIACITMTPFCLAGETPARPDPANPSCRLCLYQPANSCGVLNAGTHP